MDSKANEKDTSKNVEKMADATEAASSDTAAKKKQRLTVGRLDSTSEDVQIIYEAPPTIVIDESNEHDDANIKEDEKQHVGVTEFVSVPQVPLRDYDLHSNKDMVEIHLEAGDFLRNDSDPMDLLMPLEKNGGSYNSDLNGSDEDSQSGSGSSERLTKEERWKMWIEKYDWLLHEETDGDIAYCLYCDVRLNVIGIKYIKQHAISLYHRERTENYLEFRKMEAETEAIKSIKDIKAECDTDNRIVALKHHRASQAQALNNFNWVRWMHAHHWLVREQDDGTIGYCKYCKLRLNVEFTYLRKRHEQSKGHRESERMCKNEESNEGASRKRKLSVDNDEINGDAGDDNDDDVDTIETEQSSNQSSDTDAEVEAEGEGDDLDLESQNRVYMKPVSGSEPRLVRCTICEVNMLYRNIKRHYKTRLHLSNRKQQIDKNAIANKYVFNHTKYKKKHPWLVPDPSDPYFAYCNVCEKRFMYGHSELKRKSHENSVSHKMSESFITNGAQNAATDSGAKNEQNVAVDGVEENDENDENEDLKCRVYRGSDAWFNDPEYPWCERYKKDPNYMQCQYCNVVMSMSASRLKHQKSQRHQIAAYDHGKKPKAAKGSNYYPWLCYSKNKKIQFCKYCRVRFTNEQSKIRHELSYRHKNAVRDFLLKQAETKKSRGQHIDSKQSQNSQELTEEATNIEDIKRDIVTPASSSNEKQITMNPMYAKIQQWKQRFQWLSHKRDEQRDNYAWCKACETSIFAISYKCVSKHQRSSKHLSAIREFKKRNSAEFKELPAALKQENDNEPFEDVQKTYTWLVPDPNNEKYCLCKYCNIRLPMKVLYRRNHNQSRRHIEIMKSIEAGNESEAPLTTTTANEADNETSIPTNPQCDEQEAGTENLPNATNPTNDEFEHSLGRSETTALSYLAELMDRSVSDEPPSKQARLSSSTGSIQNPNRTTGAMHSHEKILRAVQQLTQNRSNESPLALAEGILSSSFSIAACLTPLMHSMQTQQQNSSTAAAPTPTAALTIEAPPTTPPTPRQRNTYELFCDSICETIKGLPEDLAAEGKMKMMQIVYDLEIRAMRRKSNVAEFDGNFSSNNPETTEISTTKTTVAASKEHATPAVASVDVSPPLSDVSTSSIIIEVEDGDSPSEDFDERSNGLNLNKRNKATLNHNGKKAKIDTPVSFATAASAAKSSTYTQQNMQTSGRPTSPQTEALLNNSANNKPKPNNNNSQNLKIVTAIGGTLTTPTISNASRPRSMNNELRQRLQLPSSLQISQRNEPSGQVRVVPYNKIAADPHGAAAAAIATAARQQQHNTASNRNNVTNSVATNPALQIDLNKSANKLPSNAVNSLRQIRVNTSTNSKFITIGPTNSNNTGQQLQPTTQQQSQPLRISAVNGHGHINPTTTSTPMTKASAPMRVQSGNTMQIRTINK